MVTSYYFCLCFLGYFLKFSLVFLRHLNTSGAQCDSGQNSEAEESGCDCGHDQGEAVLFRLPPVCYFLKFLKVGCILGIHKVVVIRSLTVRGPLTYTNSLTIQRQILLCNKQNTCKDLPWQILFELCENLISLVPLAISLHST